MGIEKPKSNRPSYKDFRIKEQEIREIGGKSSKKKADTAQRAGKEALLPLNPSDRSDSPRYEVPSHKKKELFKATSFHESQRKTKEFLKNSLKRFSSFVRSAGRALAKIPKACFQKLQHVVYRLQGKVECKELAKGFSSLARKLNKELKTAEDVQGVFRISASVGARNALVEKALLEAGKIDALDQIEGEKVTPQLLSGALSESARRYIDFSTRKKLLHSQDPAMHRALFELQQAMEWIVANQERTKMSWTNLMISSLSIFKVMRLENYPFRLHDADPIEEEFLSLVLDKLMEYPGDLTRELMLLPLLSEFAKGSDEKRTQLLNSLKVLEI